jgi:hypothetical protein
MANRISVAMCTYNGALFLEQQLKSIAAQTRLPDELIVCDDRSSDETVAIVKDFAAGAPFKLSLVINPATVGVVRNFSRAIDLCTGELIALCDQDDIWLPNKLARLESELTRPGMGVVFSDAELVDENGRSLGIRLWKRLGITSSECQRLQQEPWAELLRGATITGATMAFHSRYKQLCLPIPETPHFIHDAWIALIISCVASVVPMPEPLIRYRVHSGQQVGPRERNQAPTGLGAISAQQTQAAATRENGQAYKTTLTTARIALDRLTEMRDEYNSESARQALLALIQHFETRAAMPNAIWRRAPSIFTELATLRYWRFSSGLLSATKDLFYGGR